MNVGSVPLAVLGCVAVAGLLFVFSWKHPEMASPLVAAGLV